MSGLSLDRMGASSALLAGALLLGSAAAFGPALLFSDAETFSQTAQTSGHFAYYTIQMLAAIPLALALVGLVLRYGDRLGRAVTLIFPLTLAGVMLNAATYWMQAFVVPALAVKLPSMLDSPPEGMALVGMLGAGVLYMIGWVAFGIVLFRAGVLPRMAIALLMLGALITPVIGPLSNLLFGTALIWIGLAVRDVRAIQVVNSLRSA